MNNRLSLQQSKSQAFHQPISFVQVVLMKTLTMSLIISWNNTCKQISAMSFNTVDADHIPFQLYITSRKVAIDWTAIYNTITSLAHLIIFCLKERMLKFKLKNRQCLSQEISNLFSRLFKLESVCCIQAKIINEKYVVSALN